ncbi:MAG: tripartite tricarboxylate transporter substrate-binding protein, partial [Deltaproteobacteria bacterium]
EGKTIRIVVGVSAGGGFDLYARILSRHMTRYIPGKPTIIVENVTGGGGMICANQLYKLAEPDGLTIGHFNGGLLFGQVLEQAGVEFDARKFGYLGAASKENSVLWLTKASGITNLDQLKAAKTPVKLGATGVGSYARSIIGIWKEASGIPVQIVGPYKGGADIRLAAEGGEVAGSVLAWDAMKSTWGKRFETGEATVILQATPKPLPDLLKVPLGISLAKTEEGRQLIETGIHLNNIFSRPFVLGPGVPKDRMDILRAAFQNAVKDKAFIDECAKANLGVEPSSGDEIERAVLNSFKTPRTITMKLKDIMSR